MTTSRRPGGEFVPFAARYDGGECPICGDGIYEMQQIGYDDGDLVHADCREEVEVEAPKEFRPKVRRGDPES